MLAHTTRALQLLMLGEWERNTIRALLGFGRGSLEALILDPRLRSDGEHPGGIIAGTIRQEIDGLLQRFSKGTPTGIPDTAYVSLLRLRPLVPPLVVAQASRVLHRTSAVGAGQTTCHPTRALATRSAGPRHRHRPRGLVAKGRRRGWPTRHLLEWRARDSSTGNGGRVARRVQGALAGGGRAGQRL